MYDIDAAELVCCGSRRRSKAQGGVVGTVFGALAFTIVSFTCVAPFLGGFAGHGRVAAASATVRAGPRRAGVRHRVRLPVLRAGPVPGLLKTLPRSGGWLDSVKVVMGFLEVGRGAEVLPHRRARLARRPITSPTTSCSAAGSAIAVACGLYLLNVYRLPHDEEKPNIGVPRLLFALLFLGLGVYLMPALLKETSGKSQRPAGVVFAWVDAFLLPEANLDFGVDLKAAMDRAELRKAGVHRLHRRAMHELPLQRRPRLLKAAGLVANGAIRARLARRSVRGAERGLLRSAHQDGPQRRIANQS